MKFDGKLVLFVATPFASVKGEIQDEPGAPAASLADQDVLVATVGVFGSYRAPLVLASMT